MCVFFKSQYFLGNYIFCMFFYGGASGSNITELLFAKLYLFYLVLESWSTTKYMQINYMVIEVIFSGSTKLESPGVR